MAFFWRPTECRIHLQMKIYLALSTVLLLLVQISPSSEKFTRSQPPQAEPTQSQPPQAEPRILQDYDTFGHLMAPIEESQWADDCLGAQNYFRSLYVDAQTNQPLTQLTWSDQLASSAKEWAQVIIKKKPGRDQNFNESDHKPNATHGENFFGNTFGWRSNWRCAAAIRRYHEEKEYYDGALNAFHSNSSNKGKLWKFRSGAWAHYTQLL